MLMYHDSSVYVDSGSLYNAIHATSAASSELAPMPWPVRLRVALDIASALHHLHHVTQVGEETCMYVHMLMDVVA